MRWIAIVLLVVLSTPAHAEWTAGIGMDISSNMLLRSEGGGGAITSLSLDWQKKAGPGFIAWSAIAGGVQGYEGIQYHLHRLEYRTSLITRDKESLILAFSGQTSRYGEVSFLDGYDQTGMALEGRWYVTPVALVTWDAKGDFRAWKGAGDDQYGELESLLQVSRFFAAGITIRLQAEAGGRWYRSPDDYPSRARYGVGGRVARSLGPRTGLRLDIGERWVRGDAIPVPSASDSATVFERVFLDDRYQYDERTFEAGLRRLIGEDGGSMEASVTLKRRDYNDTLVSGYGYLPPGWHENETELSFSITHPVSWLPGWITPRVECYLINVDASAPDLSYSSVGVAFDFLTGGDRP